MLTYPRWFNVSSHTCVYIGEGLECSTRSRLLRFLIGSRFPAAAPHWLPQPRPVPSSTFVNFLRSGWKRLAVVSPGARGRGRASPTPPQLWKHRQSSPDSIKRGLLTRPERQPLKLNGKRVVAPAPGGSEATPITLLQRAATLRRLEPVSSSEESGMTWTRCFSAPADLQRHPPCCCKLSWSTTSLSPKWDYAFFFKYIHFGKEVNYAGPNHGFRVCGRNKWRL